MKELKLILVFLLSITIQAQIRFEEGYLIDNNNQKQVVLIKNVDWLNNPKSIEYKNNDTSKIEIATINQIKEFGIDNQSKYVRADVKIDRSSEDLDKVSSNEDPDFKEEKLFLKVLIEGEASLYGYNDYNLKRFFYKNNTGDIEQLVYKKYEVSTNQFAYNRTFRGQVAQNLKCESISNDRIKKVNYRESELIKLFTEINKCKGSDLSFMKESKKVDFNLWVRPRLNNSKITIDQSNIRKIEFENQSNITVGLEGEFVFPFNKNKWSVIVEPTYNYYKQNVGKVKSIEDYGDIASIKYSTIEIPIGLRHYFFIDNQSKIFINAQFMFSLDLDNELNLYRGNQLYKTMEINSRTNFVFGFGYNYNKKFNVEFRVYTHKNIMDEMLWRSSKMQNFSFILGYNIF
ncbi:outer membrane beta-barrel protein [Empedobacter falsenii]|uniref:outer membrane beta-barrel protein n=1 Tax=Empedobacter falsenii TaxID=343874 RepID=UPI001C8ED5B8|nr:outer membrane beta-barrel protein [Empedobacter falsenii]MBY0066053.1 PorT family protein [Empedobacter falsenii]